MWSVVARNDFDGAVSEAIDQSGPIGSGSERRVHLEVRVVRRPMRLFAVDQPFAVGAPELVATGDARVGECKMMWASFAGNSNAFLFRVANQFNTAGGTEMLAMNVCAGQFRQPDISLNDQLFAKRRPSSQSQSRAPITFVNHAI